MCVKIRRPTGISSQLGRIEHTTACIQSLLIGTVGTAKPSKERLPFTYEQAICGAYRMSSYNIDGRFILHRSWTHPKHALNIRHNIPISQESIGSNQQQIHPRPCCHISNTVHASASFMKKQPFDNFWQHSASSGSTECANPGNPFSTRVSRHRALS